MLLPFLPPWQTSFPSSAQSQPLWSPAQLLGLDSWTKLLGVIIFYAVYQQVENAYLTPRIMRAEVDLPGVAVIIALTIGAELAGLLGAIVAVPIAALIATMLDEYVVQNSSPSVAESIRAA